LSEAGFLPLGAQIGFRIQSCPKAKDFIEFFKDVVFLIKVGFVINVVAR